MSDTHTALTNVFRSFLVVGLVATAGLGCSAVNELVGGPSNASKEGGGSSPAAGDCPAGVVAARTDFDTGMSELDSRAATSKGALDQLNKDLTRLRDQSVSAIDRSGSCAEAKAASDVVREKAWTYRATIARKALGAGEPHLARNILWSEYQRDDRTDKPAYRKLSRDIAQAYDAELLAKYQKHGALGDNGEGKKMCVMSDKPFPKSPTSVSSGFSTHIEGSKLYVMCRLPRPAASYQQNVDPRFVIMLGIAKGGSVFPLKAVKLGTPAEHGQAQFLHAELDLPPSTNDFGSSTRHAFDVYLQHFYSVKKRVAGGGEILEGRKDHLAQSSFFWHRK